MKFCVWLFSLYSLFIVYSSNIQTNQNFTLSGYDEGTLSYSVDLMNYIYLPSNVSFDSSTSFANPLNISVLASICGDGIRTGEEHWDDANIQSNDGCDSTWQVEDKWTCSGGSNTTADVCKEIWGDGVRLNIIDIM